MVKADFTELTTGFMSPTGEFYPCGYMEHLSLADEIYDELYPNTYTPDPEGELVKNGWVAIHRLTYIDFGYIFDINRHLTNEQKAVIRPVFESNREDILRYNREILELEFEEC